jgi:hypothetical protein
MNRVGRTHRLLFTLTVAVVLIGLLPLVGSGQEPARKAPAASHAAPAAAPKVAMPDAEKIVLLTRTTLLTLNDALHTGNFTVMRDMAAPGFRDANTAGRLFAIFYNLIEKGVDLTAVAVLTPQLSEPPVLDEKAGMVRIKGSFPGQPARIDFEVIYQAVAGRWRLFGLSVVPAASTPVAAAPPAAAPAADAAKKAAPGKK